MLSGLGVQLLVARLVGVEGFGTWSLFMNLFLIFSTFSDWGTSLNGPQMMQLSGAEAWISNARFWRMRLSWAAAIGMLLIILVFYSNQATILLWGLPMVIFYGFMSDWYDRGKQRPDRVAYRQIIQGLAQLSGVVMVVWFKGSLSMALAIYAGTAALTFIIWHRQQVPEDKHSRNKQWLLIQLPVLVGWTAYFLTYNLPVLLLGFFSGAAITGFYSSHYFLYTSLATLSVITMDVFMAKPNNKGYGKWLLFFTLIAVLGIAASKWYYPVLFDAKGFVWDARLTFYMVILCALHAWRLYRINSLLNHGTTRSFGTWNILSLSLHIVIIISAAVVGRTYNPHAAAIMLLLAEGCTLLFFELTKKRNHV